MRRLLLILGLTTLAAAWLGPLPTLAQQAFWAHMTMHMVVVAVAAPLLTLGLVGGRFDPVLKAPRLFMPIPASVVELLVVWGWHAPLLHHWARHTTAGLMLEQGTFLLSGLFVWLSVFGGAGSQPAHYWQRGRLGTCPTTGNSLARSQANENRTNQRTIAGITALLLTSMHMTLLGALLALTPRPLYAHSTGAALEDQHLGGVIMLIVGGVVYLSGGLWLTAGLLHDLTLKRGKAA